MGQPLSDREAAKEVLRVFREEYDCTPWDDGRDPMRPDCLSYKEIVIKWGRGGEAEAETKHGIEYAIHLGWLGQEVTSGDDTLIEEGRFHLKIDGFLEDLGPKP